MELCISNLAWDNTDRLSVYTLLQNNNVPFIEIVLSKLSSEALNEDTDFYLSCKQEWESFGLRAVSMQSIHFGVEDAVLFGTDEQRANLLESTKKAIDIASSLEIKNLVFGSPKLRILPENGDTSVAIEFFTELNNYAEQKNCYLNIEANSSQYGTNFLTITTEVQDFISSNSWNNIGMNLDLSTMILEKENISEIISNIKDVRHAHISIPFLKTNFNEFRTEIEQYISSYKKSCTPSFALPTNDGLIVGVKNADTLSIEMVSQITDLELLDNTIKLVQEYL